MAGRTATDGSLTTRYTTNRTMAAGDTYAVDVTGTVKLTQITLNSCSL